MLRSDVDKNKQLENYAKYLELDIIDDWKYEDEVLKSEEAQLIIILDEGDTVCMLTAVPADAYKEFETSKYEIVKK